MESDKQTRDPTADIQEMMALEDTNVVAWLKMKGWKVVPWIEDPTSTLPTDERRVVFDVQGSRYMIKLDIQAFYDNEFCGIQDFCRNLKEVKSAMYNLRRSRIR